MTTTQQPVALRLADEAWNFDGEPYGTAKKANAAMMGLLQDCSTEISRLHARVVELEAELVKEASRTANQKIRADQMSIQHDTQAALNRDARNQLAQLTSQLSAIGAGGVESLRVAKPMSDDQMWELVKDVDPDNRMLAGRAVERYFLGA